MDFHGIKISRCLNTCGCHGAAHVLQLRREYILIYKLWVMQTINNIQEDNEV